MNNEMKMLIHQAKKLVGMTENPDNLFIIATALTDLSDDAERRQIELQVQTNSLTDRIKELINTTTPDDAALLDPFSDALGEVAQQALDKEESLET